MKLQRLHIKNFKSIVDLEIVEPNPFTVFVGPNGSGKSNIFEALEFFSHLSKSKASQVESLFGGHSFFLNYSLFSKQQLTFEVKYNFEQFASEAELTFSNNRIVENFNNIQTVFDKDKPFKILGISKQGNYKQFIDEFHRIFIAKHQLLKLAINDNARLNIAASNLEKVLKRILLDETKREEIKEWLDLFIPGFENIEIVSSDLSGTDTLVMYEKGIKKPFTKDLLSDGTYNMLALLAAVYQSDEPQFLCIEEPENGLTPYVIEQFVELFRNACQEKGHYIWLNTHSPTLVRHLRADELIVVDKKQGATQIKQFKGKDYFGLRMDEAWLTNALGGGLPW